MNQAAVAPSSPRRQAVRARLLAAMGFAIGFVGCGTDVYEQRLLRTRKLFEYKEMLNDNLQGVWMRPDLGVSMRIPKGFQQLPAPAPPKELEDGSFESVEDSRQPSFLGISLPGLVDAWQMPNSGSLYVCSNHQRLLDRMAGKAGAEPADFFPDLEATLQEGLKFAMLASASSPGEVNAKTQELIPATTIGDDQFAVSHEFVAVDIAPGEIENVPPLSAHLYETQFNTIQVAVVLIYLKSASQDPEGSLRVALETLRISDMPSRPAAAVDGSGGTPAAGGNIGF